MELALGRGETEHASYAAAVITAPSLPMIVTPPTQQSDFKRKGWKVYCTVQSRDQKVQILQKAVTSKKVKHNVTKLILVAKVNIEKKAAKVVEVVKTLNVKRCNEMRAYEFRIKDKDHELDVAMKDAELESTKALWNHLVRKESNILDKRQGKETVRRERMFWAEKIAR